MERILTSLISVFLIISLVANGVLFSNYLETSSKLEEMEVYKNKVAKLQSEISILEENVSKLQNLVEMHKRNEETLKKTNKELGNDLVELENKYNALSLELDKHKNFEKNYQAYYNYTRRYFFLEEFLKNILTEEQENVLKSYVSKAISDPQALSTSLKEITTFVSDHVKYAADPPMIVPPDPEVAKLGIYTSQDAPNLFQLPSETLERGYGDCDDINSLLYAMIKVYLKDFYGENYALYLAVATRKSGGGHLFVILPVKGGKMVVLDATGSAYWSGVELFGERFMFSGYIREAWNDYLEDTSLENFDNVKIYRLEFYGFVKKEFEGSVEEMLTWLEETTK